VFAPGEQEIAEARKQAETDAKTAVTLSKPVHVRVDTASLPVSAIEDLRQIAEDYPGPAEIVLELGGRHLRLGEAFRVQNTPTLRAELENIFAPGPAVAAAVAG